MILRIARLLSTEQVNECRRALDAAEWIDGKATVGEQGALVKNNRQLADNSPVARRLGEMILTALSRNSLFFSAALPLRTVPPLFNRYEGGEHYGAHIDGAVRGIPGTSYFLRTDLSSTLFLSEPSEYDGGELAILGTHGEQQIKLPAGDLIVYRSGSLHRVNPVTRGQRTCSFFWTQSMVPDDRHRELLFQLDTTIQEIRGRFGESDQSVALTGHYHNLLRMWTQL
ncbi:Fe2+-dependent dioxygenase [Steroidobacter agaridevorans]|uniref:Fe2+-dependent dioxygenase n=1 Tax=Steroidobacter agaridevorans TaxID=2695856 RepID=UPI00132B9099|nr:Fe2+-dependent dioxygenase [Steroidobacter agaridevorans]GFE86141.1 PKHD-type hydroxylase [Steroidobacter agaridevorans]